MNAKAISLGAVIGFILATVPSCGTPASNCGPNNCTGCCNAGTCVAPDKLTDAACGSSGNACTNCSAASQTCNMTTKSCIGSVATGGGTSGTGGGTSGTGGGTSGTGGGTSGTGGGTSGTGGGSMGTGGGTSGLPCDYLAPNCPAGTECVLNDINGTAGSCVPGACSLLGQDCMAPNTKCIVGPLADAGIARQCTPFVLGDGGTAEGGACVQAISDPCQKGAQCVGVNGAAATCRRFCNLALGCGPGAECNLGVSFSVVQGGQSELHPVCSAITACDPYTQMPCAAMEACQLYRQGTPAGCLPAGTVMGGGQCNAQALCARGFQCVVGGAGGAMGNCRAFCNVDGGAPACAAGMCQNLMGSGTGTCSM